MPHMAYTQHQSLNRVRTHTHIGGTGTCRTNARMLRTCELRNRNGLAFSIQSVAVQSAEFNCYALTLEINIACGCFEIHTRWRMCKYVFGTNICFWFSWRAVKLVEASMILYMYIRRCTFSVLLAISMRTTIFHLLLWEWYSRHAKKKNGEQRCYNECKIYCWLFGFFYISIEMLNCSSLFVEANTLKESVKTHADTKYALL